MKLVVAAVPKQLNSDLSSRQSNHGQPKAVQYEQVQMMLLQAVHLKQQCMSVAHAAVLLMLLLLQAAAQLMSRS
jgi:hypothetical protein